MRSSTITSTSNPLVRDLAALSRRRVRRDRGEHLVEGPHAVGDALEAGVVTAVYATVDGHGLLRVPSAVPVTTVAEHVLERIATTATPQGVVAVAVNRTVELDDVVGVGLLVVLDRVADPGNAGTILRTADAAGAAGVVFTAGSVDPFSPKAVRAAAGSTYHVPIVTGVGLNDVAEVTTRSGQRLVGLDTGGATSVFALTASSRPVALVLGNEAHGLDDVVRRVVDEIVSIPIHGRSESLNVAAAAAIAIYAATEGLRSAAEGPGN